ncbi:alpha-amylase [Lindgomyces ingoldianus]|uniref:Alpha-amylase n=1 Tax=Lindgomyces ingoldianus TaxID=673940 RepID=A0ACB6RA69_9PLEO|nr:alpha-amylase [Lindgomyces ingoldianus]KAF2475422.1 alpha-amylase [Lindgomyces ingoldianus]
MKFDTLVQATVAGVVASAVNAATADQWRSRSIYQVLTDRFARPDSSTTASCDTSLGQYCGGTWQGIIKQLDYIQNMGFTAIWISPVTYNIPDKTPYGYAWHGYWQQDLYKLNDHFGTADDLKALSKALHDRNMYLMVDVVVNHNGWNGASTTVDYSKFHPFNNAKYFHSFCPVDNYSNQTNVEDCWLGDSKVELPDLKTEDSAVADGYNTWIKQLVSNYSIDGLRIDTVKHVEMSFWKPFNSAAGVFCTGEVFSGDPSFTCNYQNSLDSVLNYPIYYQIIPFLNSTNGSPTALLNALKSVNSSCRDSSVLGTFTENHDVPRFASMTSDLSLAQNALAFTILSDGIPIVYAGQEQHYSGGGDPANREATWLSKYNRQSDLYNLVAAVNQVRNVAAFIDPKYLTYNIYPIYSDAHTIALRKGFDGKQVISIITNLGSSAPSTTLTLSGTSHGLPSGTVVVDILSCAQVTVSSDGSLAVPMQAGVPRVYFPVAAAVGHGICGIGTSETAAPSATNSKKSVGGLQRRGDRRRKVVKAGLAAAAAGAVGAVV